MSEKFKYAPGKPGFGTKGDQGEDGNQGLSMYFTDINPTANSAAINSRIRENLDLWDTIADALPDGRIYQNGDLFFDSEGKAYEINVDAGTFEYKYASINIGGFFLPLGINTSIGYERYFNSNATPKYIIDNVYTMSGAVNYTAVPENIYGIEPKNFTRVEYTNIKLGPNSRNAFTTYSSGDPNGVLSVENNKALAIVYDDTNTTFRIGNLDIDNKLRNTNLIFDVSNLRQTKEDGVNTFTELTPKGTVLTNYEIDANILFDSNFDPNPDTFSGHFPGSDCSIWWNLSSFFKDGYSPDSGDLYFYENLSYAGNIYSFTAKDVSVRPMVFTNIPPIGNVRITNLNTLGSYSYFIKLHKNGWTRNSAIKELFKGIINVAPESLLDEPVTEHYLWKPEGFNVTANADWTLEFPGSPVWIKDISVYYDPVTYDGSIHFGFSENTGSPRSTTMKVRVFGGMEKTINIHQLGAFIPVTFTLTEGPTIIHTSPTYSGTSVSKNCVLSATGLPADTKVDIDIHYRMYATNVSVYPSYVPLVVDNYIEPTMFGKPGIVPYRWTPTTIPQGNYSEHTGVFNITDVGLLNLTVANPFVINMHPMAYYFIYVEDFSCSYRSRIEITNVVITYRSGTPISITMGNKYASISADKNWGGA